MSETSCLKQSVSLSLLFSFMLYFQFKVQGLKFIMGIFLPNIKCTALCESPFNNALISISMLRVEFEIRSPGLHLAVNACAAAAVAVSMGVSLHQVGESLSRFKPVQMRSELKIAENGIRIINDVYNSNPTSMRTAINLLKAMECRGKRVVILGDMLELGALETEAHEDVLSMCSDSCFGMVALVGKRFAAAAEKLNLVGKINIMFATDSESLSLDIKERLTANDVVLVKGSRALQMEKVVDAIKANNT